MSSRSKKGKGKVVEQHLDHTPSSKSQKVTFSKERLFLMQDFASSIVDGVEYAPYAFMPVMQSYGWETFLSDLPDGNPYVVAKFYETFNRQISMEGPRQYETTVNEKTIRFSPEIIENYLGITRADVEVIPTNVTVDTSDDDVLRWALSKNAYESLVIPRPRYSQSDLKKEVWYIQLWATGSLYPTLSLSTVSIVNLRGMYHIATGKKLDLGQHIYKTILHYANSMPTRKSMPYPCIITGICASQRVTGLSSGNTLTHGDRLTLRSIKNRMVQLKAKRQRVNDGDGDEEYEDEQAYRAPDEASQPAQTTYSPFEEQMLTMMRDLKAQVSRIQRHLGIQDEPNSDKGAHASRTGLVLSGDIIEIIDSKQNRTDCMEDLFGNSTTKRKRNMCTIDDDIVLIHAKETEVLKSSHDRIDCSSPRRCGEEAGPACDSEEEESLSDSRIDDFIATLRSEKLGRKFMYEADMLRAFQQDEELCMNAVCALYRQQVVARKSKGPSTNLSKNGGFSPVDSMSGCALAEYLIDGDKELRLRKSVSEVKKQPPDVIGQCRKLANIYVEKLFAIYCSAEDPFFGQ